MRSVTSRDQAWDRCNFAPVDLKLARINRVIINRRWASSVLPRVGLGSIKSKTRYQTQRVPLMCHAPYDPAFIRDVPLEGWIAIPRSSRDQGALGTRGEIRADKSLIAEIAISAMEMPRGRRQRARNWRRLRVSLHPLQWGRFWLAGWKVIDLAASLLTRCISILSACLRKPVSILADARQDGKAAEPAARAELPPRFRN